MTSVAWTLRSATAADRDFVVEVNRVAMGPYLGWDDAAQLRTSTRASTHPEAT